MSTRPFQMKKRLERRKHCALAVVRRSQKILPRHRPLPGGARWPKFNQLEMVITHYLHVQTQFGEDRCTKFQVIAILSYHGNRPTNKQTTPARRPPVANKQTGPITIHYFTTIVIQ